MSPSDDFRAALRAGQPQEAFLLAMSRATELRVTTWVVPTGQAADAKGVIAPQPGRRLRTHINLLQGDIENEVGDRFLRDRQYQELRQFHHQQVGKGSEIVAQNIESLRRLFSVMQALHGSDASAFLANPTPDKLGTPSQADLEPVETPDADLPPSADWTTVADPSPPPSPAMPAAERVSPDLPGPDLVIPDPPETELEPDDESSSSPLSDPWQEQRVPAEPSIPPQPEPAAADDDDLFDFEDDDDDDAGGDREDAESAAPVDAPLTFSWADAAPAETVVEQAGDHAAEPPMLAQIETAVDADLEALFRDLEEHGPDEETSTDATDAPRSPPPDAEPAPHRRRSKPATMISGMISLLLSKPIALRLSQRRLRHPVLSSTSLRMWIGVSGTPTTPRTTPHRHPWRPRRGHRLLPQHRPSIFLLLAKRIGRPLLLSPLHRIPGRRLR
ncbi:MAG: hypothetical protein HC838_15955 [Spirulinaceae cyanobacterium RM2_2_10]|nr:hypothetical protein [Spirulinaceae cyanobacterium RM2_2_10]